MEPMSAPTWSPRTRSSGVCPRIDRGDVHSELGEGGGHLAADEPHAHHDRAPARLRRALDRVAFGDRPQVVDARELSAGYAQPPVLASGSEQNLLIPQFLARRQGQRVRRGSNRRDRVGAQVNLMGPVPVGRLDIPVPQALLRPQVLLGERGPGRTECPVPGR